MLPGHILSATAFPGTFLSPRGNPRWFGDDSALTPLSIGGLSVGDASLGLRYQVWTGSYDPLVGDVVISPAIGLSYTIFNVANLVWFDFAFDQAMRPTVTYALLDGTAHYRWYDSTIPGYTVTDLAGGTDPYPFCTLDDPRPTQTNSSDVIISYTRSGHLYFRAQRDRFGTEYDLGAIDNTKTFVQAGPNNVGRFQFEFANVVPTPNITTAFTKFVDAQVFSAIQISHIGSIKPRIYPPRTNQTTRTRS